MLHSLDIQNFLVLLISQVVKDLIKLLSSLKSLKRELRVEKGKSVIHQVKSQKE